MKNRPLPDGRGLITAKAVKEDLMRHPRGPRAGTDEDKPAKGMSSPANRARGRQRKEQDHQDPCRPENSSNERTKPFLRHTLEVLKNSPKAALKVRIPRSKRLPWAKGSAPDRPPLPWLGLLPDFTSVAKGSSLTSLPWQRAPP